MSMLFLPIGYPLLAYKDNQTVEDPSGVNINIRHSKEQVLYTVTHMWLVIVVGIKLQRTKSKFYRRESFGES